MIYGYALVDGVCTFTSLKQKDTVVVTKEELEKLSKYLELSKNIRNVKMNDSGLTFEINDNETNVELVVKKELSEMISLVEKLNM